MAAAPIMFRHYKGGIYAFIGHAVFESTLEEVTVYKGEDGKLWVRPTSEWIGTVTVNGQPIQRFTRIVDQSCVPPV